MPRTRVASELSVGSWLLRTSRILVTRPDTTGNYSTGLDRWVVVTILTCMESKDLRIIHNLGPVERPVQAGDTYRFTYGMQTRTGQFYPKGTWIQVLRPTNETPAGEIGESGVNWVCRTNLGDSVWATLEQCLSRRVIQLVSADEMLN